MATTPLRIEAKLCSALCGDPPHLDALLEGMAARWLGLPALCRSLPCPPVGSVPIPLALDYAVGFPVYRCSSPIFAATHDGCRRFARQFPANDVESLHPSHRGNVNLVTGPYKSWFLPIRSRLVDRVVWFAVGDRDGVADLLGDCLAIGKVRGKGPGRVAAWTIEPADHDWSWFAPSHAGPVLMRPLPAGDWLPAGLQGAKLDYGAFAPPYWHVDRYAEVVTPC